EMLQRFQERAPRYDRENRFFDEDFAELQKAGYLTMAVPRELGGAGYTLADVCREQRRLGYFAPATALAVNMHVYWTGLVADLWRNGDRSGEWLLREAMKGAVFAAGHAESGNDIPVLLSTTKAVRVNGGYRFTGHKSFGSLTPVWTYLGMRATRSDDTILEDVFVDDRYVARVVPAGAAGLDAFVLGVFAWALMGFGNIYCGLARRALDLTVENLKKK